MFDNLCRDSRLFTGFLIGAGVLVIVLVVVAMLGL